MDVKILMKVGLLGGSVIVGNIGSAFGWKCSEGHEHGKNEMCTTTGDRFCERCGRVHFGWEVCTYTVGLVGEFKWLAVPRNTPEGEIAVFQRQCEYGNDDKKIENNYVPAYEDMEEAKKFAGYMKRLAKDLQREITGRGVPQSNETHSAFFGKGSQQAKRKRGRILDCGKRARQQENEQSKSVFVSAKSQFQSDKEEDSKSEGGDSSDLLIREDVISGKYEHVGKRLRKGIEKPTKKGKIDQDELLYRTSGVFIAE